MLDIDDDTPLHWLLCGNECDGIFIGPHLTVEDAYYDIESANECERDHVVFEMSLRQMARSLSRRPSLHRWLEGIVSDRADVVRTPRIPWESNRLGRSTIDRLYALWKEAR